jgi:predicted ATPase with chaperone activity
VHAMPGILPEMSIEESVDVTKIYSVADQLPPDTPLIRHCPFRAPHHTISYAGLVGGGNISHPGEISLAHRGVLFLDEFHLAGFQDGEEPFCYPSHLTTENLLLFLSRLLCSSSH